MKLSYAALLLFVCPAVAQDYRASILGTVTDPSNAPIPGATVKAIKEDTNVSRETQSNQAGRYTLVGLEPGTYTVVINADGFQSHRRTGIILLTGDKLNMNFPLEVGTVTQEITVVGEQELITTATASRGLVFDPVKMQEIPLNGRQAFMLMRLSPGVMFTQRTFGSTGFSGTRAWDVNGNFTINGGRTGTNQFLLNGAPISTQGAFNMAPNVEAVQEMKIMVNTYDSQYGRSGGGHVSTTLKSGSNEWHGTVFDFWRNRVLDANTRQNNALGSPRGFRNQHQFGGTIGGPVRKDKDFVFFSFEGWRERVPFPSNVSVPPMEIRGGDFSNFVPAGQTGVIRIYDPLTSQPCTNPGMNCRSGGVYRRQPFPGNRIPASRISPIGQKILGFYPAPNFQPQALANNFTRPDNLGKYRYEQPMARYDKVLTDNDRINFLFTFQDGSEYRDQTGFDPPARWGNMTSVRRDMNYILSYDRTLSPTQLLHIQASYNRFVQNFPNVSDYDFTYDKLGIKNIPQVDLFPSRLAPRVTAAGYREMFGNTFINETSRQQLNFQANMSETRGTHSLKYGFEWAQLMRHTRNSGSATGTLDFNANWTREYSGVGQGVLDGNTVASLLLGHPSGGNINYNDTFFRREPYVAFFIQDDWKISSRLTLNLGLRYDMQFPFTEIHNRVVAGFDWETPQAFESQAIAEWRKIAAANASRQYPPAPTAIRGGLKYAGVNGNPRTVYDTDWSNIQPRLGFAYSVFSRTVMRGGIGIFHRTVTQDSQTTGFSLGTPFVASLTAGQFPSGGLSGRFSIEDPWPDGVIKPLGNSLGIATNVGGGVSYDPRTRRLPRTFQWSYTIERELPGSMVLELSYVGSLTNKEPVSVNHSIMPQEHFDAAQSNPDFYQQRLPNPWFGILPAQQGFGVSPSISRDNLLRRLPQFSGVTQALHPWGRVWYNGLQVRFEKRMMGSRARSGALTWVTAYTWSKQMERAWYDSSQTWREPFSQVTDVDRPHNFSFAGIWDLPFGKGRAFMTDAPKAVDFLIGGWTANTNIIYQSGVALGAWRDWEFLCGDPLAGPRTENNWFFNDRTQFSQCWRQLRPFEYRVLPNRFNSIRAHTAPQIDFMVSKKLRVGERSQVEFRGEAFNAFNTPLRGDAPSTNPQAANFGILPVTQLNFPRNVQLGMRVRF